MTLCIKCMMRFDKRNCILYKLINHDKGNDVHRDMYNQVKTRNSITLHFSSTSRRCLDECCYTIAVLESDSSHMFIFKEEVKELMKNY